MKCRHDDFGSCGVDLCWDRVKIWAAPAPISCEYGWQIDGDGGPSFVVNGFGG